jgi:hypothetical protein
MKDFTYMDRIIVEIDVEMASCWDALGLVDCAELVTTIVVNK